MTKTVYNTKLQHVKCKKKKVIKHVNEYFKGLISKMSSFSLVKTFEVNFITLIENKWSVAN